MRALTRVLLAAVVLGTTVLAHPVMAAVPASFQVAADPDTAKPRHNEKKDGRQTPTANQTVAFNPKTKVYHVSSCRLYYSKTNAFMALKSAQAKGGQPCSLCIKPAPEDRR
jgi:hypothetical protein